MTYELAWAVESYRHYRRNIVSPPWTEYALPQGVLGTLERYSLTYTYLNEYEGLTPEGYGGTWAEQEG